MKTTAEKSQAASPPKQQQPFLPKVGQPGFISAASVQAKLTVNTPGDEFEKEADATAEQVMRMDASSSKREAPVIRKKADTPGTAPAATSAELKKEEEGDIQRQAEGQAEVEKETIQRTDSGNSAGNSAPPVVGNVLSSSGTRMNKSTRTDMESRFGANFSNVRIHTDQKAADSARSVSAKAYTFGNHIVFNSGQYSPHSNSGKKLIAHELTHVVQQGAVVRREVAETAVSAPPAEPETVVLGNETPEGPTSAPSIEPAEGSPPAAGSPPPSPTAETGVYLEEIPAPEAGSTLPEAETATPIEPLMPEPPMELSAEEQQRISQVRSNTQQNVTATTELPSAAESVGEAREGVTEPTEEANARAAAGLVAALGMQPEPSPEIEQICQDIYRIIRERRPPDEETLLRTNPEAVANEAGRQLNDNIESDVERVEGNYDNLEESPEGAPGQLGAPIETPPEWVSAPGINATEATPDAVSEEAVDLGPDVDNMAGQMDQAGMNSPAAQVIQDGPVADARAAHGELSEVAEVAPAEVLAQQDAALESARGDMAALQAQALQALQHSRSSTIQGASQQQTSMVGAEEQMRAELGAQAETIFVNAQTQVTSLLGPLSTTAMDMWNAGRGRISTEFDQSLAEVQRWIDDRHEGFVGGVVEVWDDWTGYPDWITSAYNRAEERFGDSVCVLIREISVYVNTIILTCEQIIDDADRQISELFANAPAELAGWAAAEQERFGQRLNGLREQVASTQQNINQGIIEGAAQAVQEARQRIHELRETAKGILGRFADSVNEFLEDPARAIINGLLSLVGIEPARFWALIARIEQVVMDIANDPLGFAANLLSAIGAGFQRFFDNFLSHLFKGFIGWLFSALGTVGVEIPGDLSLSSIITFFLQLMGITWERIRRLLARHIGEENVALLEQAYQLISTLIEMGPAGIFEMIKDQLNPRTILDTVINMAVEFVRDTLITQIAARVLLMFNPVGAIAQAIEAIYKVLKWIFENAARIFSLVETVVNGMADIIAGNFSGMAAAIDSALARLLVPVIDFFMEFAHLGDLPQKVADAIRGLQEWMEGILDRVIGWLVKQARALLGIGEDKKGEEEEEKLEDSEVGQVIYFKAGGENHRLWIDARERGVRVLMSSKTVEVGEQLNSLEKEANEQGDSEAKALIGGAKSVNKQAVMQATETYKKMQEARKEDAVSEVVQDAEALDDQTEQKEEELKNSLIPILESLEGHEVPKAVFNPGFDSRKALFFEARYIYRDKKGKINHPPGDSNTKGKIKNGWEVLTTLGVSGKWARFHILNKKLGGKATDSNLILTPQFINNDYLHAFEVPLKKLYNSHKPIWFNATVKYFSDKPLFVEEYRAIGGALKYENKQWVEDNSNEVQEYEAVPGMADVGILEINVILDGDDLLWDTVIKLTSLSRKTLEILKANKPSSGYSSVEEMALTIEKNTNLPSNQKTKIKNVLGNLKFKF